MMRVFTILLVLLAYVGITYSIGLALRAFLQSLQLYRWPIAFWIILFVISFSFIIGRLHPLLAPLSIVGNYWLFFMQYGLLLILLSALLVKFTPLSTKVVGLGALAIFVLLFAFGTYFAYSPVTRELKITIDKPGEDMRIVMASDFHLGTLSHKGHLQKFVEMSNAAKPDLVLLAGDIVDDDPHLFIEKGMGDVMSQLQATYGVYGVLGNHEYYGNEIPKFKQAMNDASVQILMDETIVVENRFVLTGQEDLTNRNRQPLAQLAPENKELPWFVMNHTPNDLNTPAALGVDLHVSGHTHKGQMWPNQLITERLFDLDYGHELFNEMHGLVSSGFGFWGPPMRIGSRAELWVIDVQFQ